MSKTVPNSAVPTINMNVTYLPILKANNYARKRIKYVQWGKPEKSEELIEYVKGR